MARRNKPTQKRFLFFLSSCQNRRRRRRGRGGGGGGGGGGRGIYFSHDFVPHTFFSYTFSASSNVAGFFLGKFFMMSFDPFFTSCIFSSFNVVKDFFGGGRKYAEVPYAVLCVSVSEEEEERRQQTRIWRRKWCQSAHQK